MDINKFLDNIVKELSLENDFELAEVLGITIDTLKKFRQNSMTERQLSNLFLRAIEKKELTNFDKAIKTQVEFYPINLTKAQRGSDKWRIISSDKNEYPEEFELKERLNKYNYGIYFFYNSEGKVIYAGKTKDNLWKEMNHAFNRPRKAQKLYLVDHKLKSKPLKEMPVYLYQTACYFSVYETHHYLTDKLEAFIIRTMPNNLTNTRMEIIGN